jgi:hypothetical protein
MKPDPKKPKRRTRPPVTLTISPEAIEMSKAICRVEGSTLSRLVERMIRDTFHEYAREHGLTLPKVEA